MRGRTRWMLFVVGPALSLSLEWSVPAAQRSSPPGRTINS